MGFFVILIIIGIVFYVSTQNTKATKEKWRAAANSLGLTYIEGGMTSVGTIQGARSGHRVRVTTFTKSSGKSSQTYTKYHLTYRDRIPFDLKMTRQGALFAIKQVFGYEDVELGDPAFDAKVVVRSAQPDRARAFLTPELRDKIRILIGSYPTIEITNEHVEVTKTGRDVDPSVIGHCVRRLEGFCEDMVSRKQGRATSAPEPAREISPEPSAASILEVEELVQIDPVEPAFNPLISADPIVPDPPNVEATEPILEEPIEPDRAEETPAAEPCAELKSVAEALYGAAAGNSLASNALFSERYENRPVSGFGELKRVSRFSYDPIFKNRTGVKATYEICELADAYAKVKIKAEVAFPVERSEELTARVGRTMPIAGTLVAQDAMMRQLHIVAD